MMDVAVWTTDLSTLPSGLLVYENDYSDFIYCKAGGLYGTCPVRVFRISENVKGYEDVLCSFVARKYFPCNSFAEQCAPTGVWHDFVALWLQTVSAVKANEHNVFDTIRPFAQARCPKIFVRFEILLDLIEKYFEHILAPFEELSPYCNLPFSSWTQRTLKAAPRAHRDAELFENHLQNRFADLDGNSELATKISVYREALAILFKSNIHDTIFALSAFAYVCAVTRLGARDYSVALLLSHRALDLYLQSLCLRVSVAHVLPDGKIEYRPPIPSGRARVSVENSRHFLESRGGVLFDEESEKCIVGLNHRRNELILAHGYFAIEASEAQLFTDRARQLICRLEGDDTRWRRLTTAYKPYLALSEDSLFSAHRELESYVSPVS